MVKILVATTPAQMRDEIVKYLGWIRDMYSSETDAGPVTRVIAMALNFAIIDIEEAYIMPEGTGEPGAPPPESTGEPGAG